jgi:glycosyltransferase involved in cell wall biosynthesis
MTVETPPPVSVLVATRNRAPALARLLQSLEAAQAAAQIEAEIVVVDNGSTDDTAALLAHWAVAAPGRTRLNVEQPGKSRALNCGLHHARAPLLAFVDDDEEVAPAWLAGIVGFFRAHDYHAGVGRVLPPPDFTDPDLRRRLDWYRTIAFFDPGDRVCDARVLYGGNMVLRRSVFDAVGPFNEGLGPGAAGGWEDVDLAERLQRGGLRIGYMPDVIVYHSVDPARLTAEYFRAFQKREAHSRFAMDPQRAWRRALPHLFDAAVAFAWASVTGRAVRREHARGRLIRHAELLRLSWAARYGRSRT